MARPIKNYCDYFTHDRDMRNHRKIKAIRTKFGLTGFAIWVMVLEYLTGGDSNVFEHSEMEMELMAGDFGVSVTEISDVIDYCIKLELLFVKDGFVHSESLDDRLSTVYEKRKVSKSISKKQQRTSGKFTNKNTVGAVVSVETMPQSKVKESKVNNINKEKVVFNSKPKATDFNGLPQQTLEKACELIFTTKRVKVSSEDLKKMWEVFKVQNLTGEEYYANEGKVYSHYLNWVKKQDFKEGTGTNKNSWM